MLCYAVRYRRSFENVRVWYEQVRQHADVDVPVLLVGAQSDLTGEERKVSAEEGQAMAESLGQMRSGNCVPFLELSAKERRYLNQARRELKRRLAN